MTNPTWDDSMKTGDPLIDQQHRNIHLLVDYAEAAEDRPELLMSVLERLMEHVDCHFMTEEALMDKIDYVGAEALEHVAEHRALSAEARGVVLKFRGGELTEMKPVIEFLRSWLAGHVHDRDRRFIEFVRAQGESAVLPAVWAANPPQLNGWVA